MQSSVSATRQTLPAASQEGTGVPSGYSFENLSSVICHLSSVFLLANLRNSLPLRWKRSRDTCAPSLQQGITLRRGRGGGGRGREKGRRVISRPRERRVPLEFRTDLAVRVWNRAHRLNSRATVSLGGDRRACESALEGAYNPTQRRLMLSLARFQRCPVRPPLPHSPLSVARCKFAQQTVASGFRSRF